MREGIHTASQTRQELNDEVLHLRKIIICYQQACRSLAEEQSLQAAEFQRRQVRSRSINMVPKLTT